VVLCEQATAADGASGLSDGQAESPHETPLSEFEGAVERNYRHNAIVTVLDGALWWWGSSFVAARTVLPLYVSHFTESTWAIGLLSTVAAAGWFLPQLLTANWVERLPRKKVVPVNVGLFSERLPMLLMAPAALLARRAPALALIFFFVLYFWHTLGGGIIAVGWQDMFAKVIPLNRRARLFGLTNFVGMGGGALTAIVASRVLGSYGFPDGYVVCFAAAGLLIFASWAFLAWVREPALSSPPTTGSQRAYWQRLPAIVRQDANFRRYLGAQVVINFSGMAAGFITVYVVQRWLLPDNYAGAFTISMLVGQSLSNLVFGAIADRKGHKLVLELSALLGASAVGLAFLAPAPLWFHLVFVLSGMSVAGFYQSGLMITMEFCAAEIRPTYIGLNNTVSGIAAALSPLMGAWLAGAVGYRGLFAAACGIGVLGFALLHWWVQEPRRAAR